MEWLSKNWKVLSGLAAAAVWIATRLWTAGGIIEEIHDNTAAVHENTRFITELNGQVAWMRGRLDEPLEEGDRAGPGVRRVRERLGDVGLDEDAAPDSADGGGGDTAPGVGW